MSTIVTRSGKGSPLSHVEVDANFNNLNTDKVEKTAAAITGGTINGTTIGATTPSTVNATTITGQTGVLRGTGQNLIVQSGWAGGTSGTVGSGAVAPTTWSFGSTGGTVTYASALSGSGNSIRFAASSQRPFIQQALASNFVVGITYSVSFNVETVTSGSITLANIFSVLNTTATLLYYVDGVSVPSSTVLSSNTNIQIVLPVTAVSASSTVRFGVGVNGSATGDVTLSNPQLEVGSVENTYIPTTTTAVYGTPTLSFSGVSTIGLESNGSLFVQPAGTGALQAQATTSTATGGNARGANAVDWQTSRNAANQVASNSNAVIGGGNANLCSGFAGSIVGGSSNISNNNYTFVGGGLSNTASSPYAIITGGYANTSAGYLNFVGAGYGNSGTASAAVTTQSGTMNATTAVTLSGSNASIKVGQLITGTSINSFPNTYVAAISGTSLTLSQNASGSSTSTLSFFTPHGVVVGGGNNQATGSYSFIGGGGDAGSSANRNVASGDWSVVAGGIRNVASGAASFIGGGGYDGTGTVSQNTASGVLATIAGGRGHTASGLASFIGSGFFNTANSSYSTIAGGVQGTTRGIEGNYVFPACVIPITNTSGVSQSALLVLGVQTTDATATALRSNSSAAGTTNQVILPNNSAYFFRGEVISGVTGGGNTKGWYIEGVIKRGANAASTALVGTPTVTSSFADAGASAWDIAVTADTTNGGIRVTFTGQAATTIRTVCRINTVEMTF
jgi:hypothetical protein